MDISCWKMVSSTDLCSSERVEGVSRFWLEVAADAQANTMPRGTSSSLSLVVEWDDKACSFGREAPAHEHARHGLRLT